MGFIVMIRQPINAKDIITIQSMRHHCPMTMFFAFWKMIREEYGQEHKAVVSVAWTNQPENGPASSISAEACIHFPITMCMISLKMIKSSYGLRRPVVF